MRAKKFAGSQRLILISNSAFIYFYLNHLNVAHKSVHTVCVGMYACINVHISVTAIIKLA